MSENLPAGAVRTVLPPLLVPVLSATPPVARAAVLCADSPAQHRSVRAQVGSDGESDEVRLRSVRMPTRWAMAPLSTYAAVPSDGKIQTTSGGWLDNPCDARHPDASRTVLLSAPPRGILRIATAHGAAPGLHGRHHARVARTRVIAKQCDSAVVLSLRNAGPSSPHPGLPSHDLAGAPRVVEGLGDIGACQFESVFSDGVG